MATNTSLASGQTTPHHLGKILEVITRAGEAAAAHALEMQRSGFERFSKVGLNQPDEIFTSADVEAQRIVVEHLTAAFPDVPIVAEEQAEHHITTRRYFTIDPIDGTLCFADGGTGWGCIIGYIEDGLPAAGMMASPAQHGVATASRGQGCFVNGTRIEFSGDGPDVVVAAVGPWTPPHIRAKLNELQSQGLHVVELRSVVDATFRLLTGEASMYIGGAEKVWDVSGPAALISEAGGLIRAVGGSDQIWTTVRMPSCFAVNQRRMDQLLFSSGDDVA